MKIILKKSGRSVLPLSERAPNTGRFGPYVFPDSIPEGFDYRVRIESLEGPVSDESDGVFTIYIPRTIAVIFPDGGERLSIGKPVEIRWKSTGKIDKVRILLKRGGKNILTIRHNAINMGSLIWIIPEDTISPGEDYLLRIESSDGSVFDESSRTFLIVS